MTERREPATEARYSLMTEEELLIAVTEALDLYGYVWTHSRRSDKALTMGHQGVPDIIAARKGRVVFLELKTEKGPLQTEQLKWAVALDPYMSVSTGETYRLVRPSNLDDILRWLA